MEKEHIFGKMVRLIKGNFKMEKDMVMENGYLQRYLMNSKETYILDTIKMIERKERENTHGKMDTFIKVNSLTI
jgi:hypothetical protein